MVTHAPVSRAGSEVAVKESSCSVSSPPSKAPSAPKSTSFTLKVDEAEGSGVQMSIRNRSMAVASMVSEVNSMPAKTRFV